MEGQSWISSEVDPPSHNVLALARKKRRRGCEEKLQKYE
jgi:hypothetical protein